ncbi:tetratricopeptide repeat protein [Pendulispora rubella]|uniref:Tetratricopeptide repeat protein n=1 Tax=Pendulispora rubella TaxID=2741070 RepID=A0ABZ2LED1_9BACT
MKRALFLAALFVALGAAGSPARADTPPNPWDVAKNPQMRGTYEVHVRARERMIQTDSLPLGRLERDKRYEEARAILEEAHAAESPDVRLRFDLGTVYESLNRHAAAAAVLEKALAMAPDHPAAEDAWLMLAYAYAHGNQPLKEREAYVKYLQRATYGSGRVTATLNLAEAEMRLGHLEEAISGYREAIQLATLVPSAGDTGVLAVWGLAVALDRHGDTSGAMAEAKWATEIDHRRVIEDTVNVFFVPEYERLWYFGLREMALGRGGKNALESALHFRRAESMWSEYVDKADPADPWRSRARIHRDSVKKEREEAERRIKPGKKGAVEPLPHDEVTF